MNLTVMQDGSERIHYGDPAIPIYVSTGDLKSLSNMSALCHWHEDVELLMPLEGYLTYNVDGQLVTVHRGDAIFVNARHMHYGFSADGSDCFYVCVTFRPQLLCASEEIRSRFVMPILTSPNLTHMLLRGDEESHEPMLASVRAIHALYDQAQPGFELRLLGELYALWQGLYSLARGRIDEAVSADGNVQVQKRMLEFIRTHYQERITVDAIAASGGVCRTKCCQLFRKYLDQTPNDYLNSFRLEKGMELLKSSSMTVTEIADRCGFSSSSYFTELFTRRKGCPPTQYRKNS